MRVDFNKLKTFTTVADEESLTQASHKLHLTQQAVSHQIRHLEEELGFNLFKRANKRIYLTKEGKSIYLYAKQALCGLEESIQKLKHGLDSLTGVLHIGGIYEVASKVLLPLIQDFNKVYPNVRFDVHIERDRISERELLEHKLDMAFLVNVTRPQLLQVRPFLQEPFSLVCSPGLIKKYGPARSLHQILDWPLVDLCHEKFGFNIWLQKNGKNLLPSAQLKRPVVNIQDHQCLRELALNGVGMAVLPHYLVSEDLLRGRLVEIFPQSHKIEMGIYYVMMKKRSPSLLMSEFSSFAFKVPRERFTGTLERIHGKGKTGKGK